MAYSLESSTSLNTVQKRIRWILLPPHMHTWLKFPSQRSFSITANILCHGGDITGLSVAIGSCLRSTVRCNNNNNNTVPTLWLNSRENAWLSRSCSCVNKRRQTELVCRLVSQDQEQHHGIQETRRNPVVSCPQKTKACCYSQNKLQQNSSTEVILSRSLSGDINGNSVFISSNTTCTHLMHFSYLLIQGRKIVRSVLSVSGMPCLYSHNYDIHIRSPLLSH